MMQLHKRVRMIDRAEKNKGKKKLIRGHLKISITVKKKVKDLVEKKGVEAQRFEEWGWVLFELQSILCHRVPNERN